MHTSIGQVREIRYRAIADDLRRRVEAGEFAAGRLLPSEAELSAAYEASRVTVRKALEVLRDEGLVDARQGFGWFVAADPLRQSLGRLGTIEAQLAESGRARPSGAILDFGFVAGAAAGPRRCSASTRCSRCAGSTWPTASRSPGSRCGAPSDLGAHLSRADVERVVVLRAARRAARRRRPDDRRRGGRRARRRAARGARSGSPVLRCERVTVDRRRRGRCC